MPRRIAIFVVGLGLGLGLIAWIAILQLRPERSAAGDAASQTPLAGIDPADWQVHLTGRTQDDEPNSLLDAVATASPSADSGYIGSEACRACHLNQHESYLATTHSRALSITREDDEAADDGFDHSLSSRRFEVVRRDGKLRHRETVVDADGRPLARIEHPPRYTVGSGEHGRSYLAVIDGFLVQSPLSNYTEKSGPGWGLSPGYDAPTHRSFHRQVTTDCLFCHAGQIDPVGESMHRYEITELAIGCERCHGPGGGHRDWHEAVAAGKAPAPDWVDEIVNPAKLPRQESIDVCAQCHLQGVTHVAAEGQDLWDFRPGQKLEDNRTDFRFSGTEQAKIVGHVEELHQSACFIGSDAMTCLDCHNPHDVSVKTDRLKFYREACLNCHELDACGLPGPTRFERNQDDCAACHMPKRDTDVPHAALHDHRISIPAGESIRVAQASDPDNGLTEGRIVPVLESSGLSEQERVRRNALAAQIAIRYAGYADRVGDQGERSLRQLIEQISAGEQDPMVLAWVATEAVRAGDLRMATALANRALRLTTTESPAGLEAHAALAAAAYQAKRWEDAVGHYRHLTRHRRSASDHRYLATCFARLGQADEAIAATEQALRIDPTFLPAHGLMVELLRSSDPARAAQHASAIQALQDVPR